MLVGSWLAPAAWPATRAPAADALGTPAQPLVVQAVFSYVDYKTDTAVFKDVAISQGDTRVSARQAQAAGLGFGSSRWTFEGNVIILMRSRGRLSSQRAIVQFRNNRVTRATVTGSPAVFEGQRGGSRPAVQGHADRIVYDSKLDTVRLSGEAWLSGEHNERLSGPLLIYSIRNQSLEAVSSGSGRRVHITVIPQAPRESASRRRSTPPTRAAGPR